MFLFRVEHENTLGPYAHRELSCREMDCYQRGDRHPMPRTDPALRWDHLTNWKEYIFGFGDIKSARKWWYKKSEYKDWSERGFRLMVCYRSDCRDYKIGEAQAIFIRPERFVQFGLEHLHGSKMKDVRRMADEQLSKMPY